MRIAAFLLTSLTFVFAVAAPARAYERPDARRPYVDGRETVETHGYGKLELGASPSGWLLCEDGKALVGVTARRGRVIDNVRIHCAAIIRDPAGGSDALGFPRFTWNSMDNNPGASAGGPGGQDQRTFQCPPGFIISGMAGRVNADNELFDLAFECARALGSFDQTPSTRGVSWFEPHCQPSSRFTIFPVDNCVTDQARQQLNQMRFRDKGTGELIYRQWMPGFGNVRGAGDEQKCERYGAVGLTFLEQMFRMYGGLITVVVPSLRLICIAPDSVLRRLRPLPRR